MALSSLFANNAAWAPTPFVATSAQTDPVSLLAEPTPSDLLDGGRELSHESASYIAQYYVDALSEPTRLADSPLFRKPPVGLSQMDLLSRHLGIVWDTFGNPRLNGMSTLPSDAMPRHLLKTKLIYKLLLMSKLGGEKDLRDIRVSVEGHAMYTSSIAIMLSLGATVISRDLKMYQDDLEFDLMHDFKFSHYLKTGQLIPSPYNEPHPGNCDIVIWEHPTVFAHRNSFDMGDHLSTREAIALMTAGLAPDGLFVLQSDLDYYVNGIVHGDEWTKLLHRTANDDNYLVPSNFLNRGWAALVIAQRMPK